MSKQLIKYIISVFLPLLVGGIVIGSIFGVVGYYMSLWFELFEKQLQHEMVFWLFAGMGVFGGAVGAIQSLIVFLKQPSPE